MSLVARTARGLDPSMRLQAAESALSANPLNRGPGRAVIVEKRSFRLFSTMCLAAALSGCATVTTAPIASADAHDPSSSFNATAAAPGKGIAYFLPRQLAKVTVTRVKQADVKLPKQMAAAIKAQKEAQDAVDAASAAVEEATAGVAAAENAIIAAASSPPDGMEILNRRLDEQQTALTAARHDLVTAQDSFASKTETIKALDLSADAEPPAPAKQDYLATVAITLLPPSADPRHGFRMDPRHSWLRDDTHRLTLSATGLLTTSNVVAVDRTGDIVVALAQAIGAIGAIPAKMGVLGANAANHPAPDECEHVPSPVTLIVDFASSSEVNMANGYLNCMGVRLAIVSPNPTAPSFPAQSTARFDGIAYRTPVEQWVAIQVCAMEKVKDCHPMDGSVDPARPMWRTSQVVALTLPQAGPISYLPQNAGFLTRTSYNAAFQDGMLTSYDDDRPSEALQLAGMPIRIIDGVFDGISHVISLRTGVSKAQLGLSQVEKDKVAAQYDLLAARIKGSATISDAQKAVLDSQVALSKAGLAGQGSLADAQAALLQQQTNLIIAQTNAPTQILDNHVTDTVKALKDQAKLQQLNACLAAQRAAGQPIDSCLD
jgi:hypothetical protein